MKLHTSFVASVHHSSSSANPDFTYSPLLNVQHSFCNIRLENITLPTNKST